MKKTLTWIFVLLYAAVGFVSVYHAIDFFSITNGEILAIILSIAFELTQGTILFALLTTGNEKNTTAWCLMTVTTIVQIIGNCFACYKYMIINNPDQIKYFIDSILWFIKDPDPQTNIVICSYISGAILPLIALGLTAMVVDINKKSKENKDNVIKINEDEDNQQSTIYF